MAGALTQYQQRALCLTELLIQTGSRLRPCSAKKNQHLLILRSSTSIPQISARSERARQAALCPQRTVVARGRSMSVSSFVRSRPGPPTPTCLTAAVVRGQLISTASTPTAIRNTATTLAMDVLRLVKVAFVRLFERAILASDVWAV